MITLKPCPFCGSAADTDFIPDHHSYRLECRDTFGCGAQITAETADDVIARWNTRSAAPCLHQIAEPARVPLTAAQIDLLHSDNCDAYERGDVEYESRGLARAIEAAHGIKSLSA